MSTEIASQLDKAVGGERLTPEEGLSLLQSHDLVALGQAADAVTRRLHPEPFRTYNIDRNINYTNACTAVCDFCAFYRPPNHPDVYVLERDVLFDKIEETVALGGDQILMQGGLHPKLPLEWYEELLRDIKAHFPQVNVHGFSPPEIHHFAKLSKLPLREVLARLKEAGLGSLPGGGGEILVDRVRREITRGKVLTDDWLNVHRVWHELGGRSTATMMFGHVETLADRIEHLERLRQLQDETGGFTAFICWTFQPPDHAPWFGRDADRQGRLTNLRSVPPAAAQIAAEASPNPISGLHDKPPMAGRSGGIDMSRIPPAGAFEYLKTQAVSRLYLDNVANIQSSWVTQGEKIGQLALLFGANDMGSLMIEENVVAEAGTVYHLSLQTIRRCIREVGFIPRQRNVFYDYIDCIEQSDFAGSAGRTELPVLNASI